MSTLAEVREDTRAHLDEVVPQFWEDSELDRWIYEASRDVARRAEVIQKVRPYAVIGSQLTYPDPPDVATRIFNIEYRQSSGNIYPLTFVPFNELYDYAGGMREIASAQPYLWSHWGTMGKGEIYPFPVPSVTIGDGLRVYYYALPARLLSDDQEIEIPAGWSDLIPLYAEIPALRKARDPRFTEAFQLYEARLEQMISLTRQPSDQQANHISPMWAPASQWWGPSSDWY